MPIKKLDHVSIVVDDLAAAVEFFTVLGMSKQGKAPIEGEFVDRLNALQGIKVDIVMMQTEDGGGKLELTKFRHPPLVDIHPSIAPPNALGLRSIMFTVDSLEETLTSLQAVGAELIGEVVDYENQYKLCYLRGPAGTIIALAEELF